MYCLSLYPNYSPAYICQQTQYQRQNTTHGFEHSPGHASNKVCLFYGRENDIDILTKILLSQCKKPHGRGQQAGKRGGKGREEGRGLRGGGRTKEGKCRGGGTIEE